MYSIEFFPDTVDDLAHFRKFDQSRIMAELSSQLSHDADVESRNRKRLRPNQLAEWELRVDTFRIFYDVDIEAEVVKIVAIGEKKGNELFIRGERYEL